MPAYLTKAKNILHKVNRLVPQIATYASILTPLLLCCIVFMVLANSGPVASISTEDDANTPYSERIVRDSFEISSKNTMETFSGNGFTPEGPAGTEPNIPPGYKDRDYQKAKYSKIDSNDRHNVALNYSIGDENQKIIQNAAIDIETRDVKIVTAKIAEKSKNLNGFVEKEFIKQDSRDRYIAEMIVRVKAENVPKFLQELGTLGNVRSSQNTLSDITSEYRDTKIRLENKMKVRASIIRILERQSGNIKDIIEGTKELSEITENIETLQASIKQFDDKVLFATVAVRIYEPSAILPDRGESIGKKILASFGNAGYLFIDVLAFLIKSLGVILPVALVLFFIFRKRILKPVADKIKKSPAKRN